MSAPNLLYPTVAIDSFVECNSAEALDRVVRATVIALQTKVGVNGSADPTSLDYQSRAISLGWLNAKGNGVTGDGRTDDTAALQACLGIIELTAGTLYLPPGTYLVSSQLLLARVTGARVMGAGLGATIIQPTGALVGQAVLRVLDCRNVEVSDLAFYGAPSAVLCAIQFYASGSLVTTSTNNRVRRCRIGSPGGGGLMTHGLQWAAAGGNGGIGDQDNDDSVVESCYFINLTQSGANILHSNSLWHRFTDCSFVACATGIWAATGSFAATSCSFSCSAWDFQIATDATQTIYHGSRATNCQSEANEFIAGYYCNIGAGVSSSTGALMTFVNCERIGSIAGTGNIIQCNSVGAVLTLVGCTIITGQLNTIAMLASGRLILVGCTLGLGTVSYNGVWVGAANYYLALVPADADAGTSLMLQMGDFNSSVPAVYNGLRGNMARLTTNQGPAARNIRSAVTISDGATTAAVAFDEHEVDGAYYINLGAGPAGGSPAAGSLRASWASKGVAGFTIVLEAAPGTGNSVQVDWFISR